ncbi:hypothetical protein F4821DRAFT_247107 [Hypoxylon rubiginosum]|uniref:Uncharacterized protein n=1 Tax=Hypoxylon rubiginosum TaxID=110542 RepID=A0ACC0CPX9_9PEZI|nr:hypothetical protein F4821DRAFT_247107 [Hypoxylon rubiginosum]
MQPESVPFHWGVPHLGFSTSTCTAFASPLSEMLSQFDAAVALAFINIMSTIVFLVESKFNSNFLPLSLCRLLWIGRTIVYIVLAIVACLLRGGLLLYGQISTYKLFTLLLSLGIFFNILFESLRHLELLGSKRKRQLCIGLPSLAVLGFATPSLVLPVVPFLRILLPIIACTLQRLLIATILAATVYHTNKKVLRQEILWICANFIGGGLSFPALCFELPGSLLYLYFLSSLYEFLLASGLLIKWLGTLMIWQRKTAENKVDAGDGNESSASLNELYSGVRISVEKGL